MNLGRLSFFAVLVLAGCSKSNPSTQRPVFAVDVLTTGTSMVPTFPANATVRAEFAPFEQVKSGDTVIRWHELTHQYIHHRVLTWDSRTGAWFTQGDNNATPDRSLMFRADYVAKTHKL